MTDAMRFSDSRLPPFAWVSRPAANVLTERLGARERPLGLAIYLTIALLSSEQYRSDHDGIEVARKELAERVGVSVRTLDSYVARLEEIGLLRVSRRKDEDGVNLPNSWSLVEPQGVAQITALPSSVAPGVVSSVAPGVVSSNSTPFKEEGVKEEEEENNSAQTSLLQDPVHEVWDHYQQTFPTLRRTLDSPRRTCIKRALKVRSVDECKLAITALSESKFHNGDNADGKKYLDIHYALGKKTESPDERIDQWVVKLGARAAGLAAVPQGVQPIAALGPGHRENARRVLAGTQAGADDYVLQQARSSNARLLGSGIELVFEGTRIVGWRQVEPRLAA